MNCRFELDTGFHTAECTVESDSTVGRKSLLIASNEDGGRYI